MSFEFIETELGNFVEIVTKKCDASIIDVTNYISTENMLPDRQGVTISSGIPDVNKFNSFEIGDTLFSNIRTYFKKVWFATFYGGVSPDVLVFRTTHEKLTSEYLHLILSSDDFINYSHLTSKGAKMPRGDKGAMLSYKIKIPSLKYQKRCTKLIFTLSKKIDSNNRINQTLEQMAQALFKSWFVDFDPVKAKMAVLDAGGSQADATLAAMTAISGKDADALAVFEREHPEQYAELKATAELFPAAMQDSELGAIPKGWGVASISEMGKVTCGKTPSKKEPEYYGSDVPFIKIPDMHGQLFVLKTNEYLSEAGSKSQLKKLVPANSICVSCIATIGVVSITNEPSHTNQQINSVTPHKSSLLYYLYFCMLGLKDHLHILGSAGSATLNVNTSTFSGIKIAQPDAKVLELFHAKCTHLFNEIKSLSVQTESLRKVRTSS